MDRHQYVKTLIEQRDNLKKEIESLNSKIGIAKKRTKDAVLNFKPELCYEASSSTGFNFSGGYQTVQYVTLPENELVSDDAIKTLHKEIFELENSKSVLDSELSDLQSRDFVKYLKNLINES